MSYNSEDVAICVKNVSKVYKIFQTPGKRFLYHLFHTSSGQDFVALDNVSFDVKRGESFGIIGRNGSGKSTLLQLLAGIINATSGQIETKGRIAALLELGSGFNPESTGLENIYMNAAILGVSKEEIDKRVDEIINFADIGDFINQPVKTYSSGMFVRLAFAVAINVDADIILIDEALAVGDVFFRQKCYTKLNQLKESGKTIVLVSHGMNEVEQFCDRALLLRNGRMLELGCSKDVVKKYYITDVNSGNSDIDEEEIKTAMDINRSTESSFEKISFDGWEIEEQVYYDISNVEIVGDSRLHIKRVGLFDELGMARRVFTQGEWGYFYYELDVNEDIDVPLSGIVIRDQRNINIHGKDSLQVRTSLPKTVNSNSVLYVLQKIKLDLGIGDYTFELGTATMKYEDYANRSVRTQEEVNATMDRLAAIATVGSFSIHSMAIGNPMQLMFHGCADLPGSISVETRRH